MQVFEAQEVATIAPAAAAAAHRQFEHLYAAALAALPERGLRWRIDVETREPGQSPEQQHQLVIWDPLLRHTYGLRLWLRADGTLDSLTGDRLTAVALLARVHWYQKEWRLAEQQERRHDEQLARKMESRRRGLYLVPAAFIVLNAMAAAIFGPTRWVQAGRDTCVLLVVMGVILDGWLRWQRSQPRLPAKQPV